MSDTPFDVLLILFLIVAVGGTAGVLMFTSRGMKRMKAGLDDLTEERLLAPARAAQIILRDGRRCTAKVVSIGEGRHGIKAIGDDPLIHLVLDVTPLEPEGIGYREAEIATYRAEVELVISYLHIPQYQPGCTLAVRADRADLSKIAIEGTDFSLLESVRKL